MTHGGRVGGRQTCKDFCGGVFESAKGRGNLAQPAVRPNEVLIGSKSKPLKLEHQENVFSLEVPQIFAPPFLNFLRAIHEDDSSG